MATLDTRPVLATAPANNDYYHIVDISDLTASPQGTSKQQDISVLRTHGDTQVTTYDNAGTMGPNAGEIHMDLALAGFFRIRDNANANILSVTETGNVIVNQGNLSLTTGDININTGDLIVQAGDINVQAGGADLNGALDMNSNLIQNVSGIQSNDAMFIQITNANGGISMVGVGTTCTITADTTSLSADLSIPNGEITAVLGIDSRSGAADPTNLQVTNGFYTGWYNTTLNEFRIWYNDGGTMVSSAAFT